MSRRLTFALFLSALALGSAVTAGDWPQWRGPNRDEVSEEKGLLKSWPAGGPKLLWQKTDLADVGTGYGSPAVVGDKLYLVGGTSAKKDATELVTCLSVKDGVQVWQTKLETSKGSFNDNWGGGPRSTPTVDGDRLYVLGATGDLVCLAAADGKVVWKKNLVTDFGGKVPFWGYSESPLVDGDKVVVTPGVKTGMVALDKKTGEPVWKCTDLTDEAGYSSIVVGQFDGVKMYVTQTMKAGVGVSAADGKLLWSVGEIGRRTAVIPTPILYKEFVFFTAGYGAGCELAKLEKAGDKIQASLVYTKNKVVANHHGGVVRVGDKVYGHSDSVGWFCFDFLKGGDDPVWASKKLGKGSVTYAEGSLYCYGEDKGDVVKAAASPDEWKEEGRFAIPQTSKLRPKSGKIWPHPVVSNGKLYLRDYELLYVYDVSGPGA